MKNSKEPQLRMQNEAHYPFLQGGSKARKLKYILQDAQNKQANAIVSAGSAFSNHARDCALAAAQLGWKCLLFIHDKPELDTNNIFIMKLSGAKLIYCNLEDVGALMDQAMADLQAQGFNPYYIWGGGHSVYGSLALFDAAREYLQQSQDWQPDYVIVPSGTGGTQAGLHLGFAQFSSKTRVIGISVARNRERGLPAVENAVNELKTHLNLFPRTEFVQFYDNWVGAGYGESSQELVSQIKHAALRGILLDSTYTGKAWLGMNELIRKGTIPRDANILFWNTGGVLNLLDQKAILGGS